MGRTIQGTSTAEFLPLVGIRNKGNYVKGEVLNIGQTTKGNPAVTLRLLELDGNTSKALSNGNYQEVDVNEGDEVQIIGSHKDLRAKLPQLEVGNIVTITNMSGRKKIANGRTVYEYRVEVD